MYGFNGFDAMMVMMQILFPVVFAMILVIIVRTVRQWHYDNGQPRLTVDAAVITKRTEVHHHMGRADFHTTSWYYVTFEVESGDRFELGVSPQDYGLIAEGDYGRLTFQGSRFLGFERQ